MACAHAAPPAECKKTETVSLELEPAPLLNQGEDGSPRSVTLRVYQLAKADSFERASYDELWAAEPKAVLGDALLAGPDEAQLVPGRPLRLQLKRHPDAQLVALAGKFRRFDGAWRAIAALPAPVDPCSKEAASSPLRIKVRAVDSNLRMDFGGAP